MATIILLLMVGNGYAQLGPGGVSNDTPNSVNPTQSDVRLWLDAGSLTNLADGDDVSQWNDISPSAVNDRAFRQSSDNFLPPYFRDDPSATINGYPVLTFEDGRMLKVNSSNDLNTSIQTTYEQTIVFAFRTSEDINSRQVIWEEGGAWRGINIFIFNGQIYLGAYDKQPDNDPGSPNVPPFGYSYVRTPIQPNTTYVLSHIFSAPTDNSLNGYIQGYQNGSFFGTLETGGQYNAGIGGVFRHPDPIGIGAVNSDSFMETGPIGNQTGTRAFKGRLAEICYYNRLLNSAERIIVENYLGAKYYANIIVNDRYEHQAGYGKGVIGIGQTSNNAASRHTVSKGINIFEISPVNEGLSFNSPNEFLLVGNNGAPLIFTEENTPNDPGSTMRTERIWRFDESGETNNIKFRFYPGDLPTLPSGFSKYVLIFDESSPNFPNFTTVNSKVVEILPTGGGFYEAEVNVQDNAFLTLGVIKPQVSFRDAESFALESNPGQDSTVYVNKIYARLNYVPESAVKMDFEYTDGTATRANDYGYLNSDVANGITFPPGIQEVPIRIWVKNDVIAENPGTENVLLNLVNGPNTTAGVGIGAQNQHVFTIYDDDPPPKLSFAQGISATLESGGSYGVQIVRTGSTSGTASARIRVISTGTTATANDDYTYPAFKTVTFTPGESVDSVSIDIADDMIDEVNENIRLQMYFINGAGTDASSILFHDVEILDDDLPPTVEFTSTTSQSFETNGTPRILIELDQPSSKEVTINYTKLENLSTAASYGNDYTLTFPGTVVIQPGDTLALPENLIIMQDGVDEDDETIEFQITSAINANLGSNLDHVYTIKDYSTFEWKGAGGVGKDSDNVFWIEADRQSGSHNSTLQTLTNFSPQNINISQSSSGERARLQTTSNLINGKKTLRFDGSNDHYTIENSGLINLAPSVSKKAYFMTLRTSNDVTNWQTIYKQGGGSRGIAIYIHDGSMYFHAWNNPNDGPESPWGAGSG
ncbi:MAG: Calx-beta domain-containing protein, partial [Cryomorphaceae bacterium]